MATLENTASMPLAKKTAAVDKVYVYSVMEISEDAE